MQFIYTLKDIDPEDIERYGGKAVNLVKLMHLGFHVPGGFSISSDAFVKMLKEDQSIISFLREADASNDFEEILEISGRVQKVITDYVMPKDVTSEIEEHLSHLKMTEAGFAVRSSATIEDRNDISFAGQAESYLCVKKLPDIIESVKKVWKSAFSERALIYLKTKGIPFTQVKMAVLLQEMIPAEVSGVMFTANVVTNNTEEMLINSTWGLGDILVSGEIVPDTYILTKSPLRVIQRNLGEKERTSELKAPLTETPQEKREKFSLDEQTLFALAEVGLKIESGMESPQDIEWCLRQDGILTILQARPITTLNLPSSDGV
jgi:phosphoenolpyruvate synthase/pyruvate phosphate dikinase